MLTIALSLGLGLAAIFFVLFSVWIVFGEELKRWVTCAAALAFFFSLFAYLLAMAIDPALLYVGLGFLHGLMDAQRCIWMRAFIGTTLSVFLLQLWAGLLIYFTGTDARRAFAEIVLLTFVGLTLLIAWLAQFFFRRMEGVRPQISLSVSAVYYCAFFLVVCIGSSPDNFLPRPAEFTVYALMQLVLAAVATFHVWEMFGNDPDVGAFTYIAILSGDRARYDNMTFADDANSKKFDARIPDDPEAIFESPPRGAVFERRHDNNFKW